MEKEEKGEDAAADHFSLFPLFPCFLITPWRPAGISRSHGIPGKFGDSRPEANHLQSSLFPLDSYLAKGVTGRESSWRSTHLLIALGTLIERLSTSFSLFSPSSKES